LEAFSPLIVRVFSLATIEISFGEKPETATEIRKLFSPVRSML
jgi:hypothetical protein